MKKLLLLTLLLLSFGRLIHAQIPLAGWILTTDSVQCLNRNSFFGDDTSVVNGNYNKTWYYGDGDSCHCLHANHSYKSPGRYEIKLVIEQNGIRDSMSHFVTVLASASPSFSMSHFAACRGSAVMFEDTVAERYGAQRIWDFGDGTFDTSARIRKIYQRPGAYAPMLKYIYANGCNDSNNNLSLDIYPAPEAKIAVNTKEQCLLGNIFQFRDESVNDTGLNYVRTWTGSVTPAVGDSITFVFLQEGNAWLKLFYDGGNGCVSMDSVMVTALKDPVVDWTFTPSTFCEGDSFSMSVFGSLPPGNYPWLHYQLYKNDTLVRDDTTAIFRGLTQAGNYLVKSFNGICADSTTSFYVTGIPKIKSKVIKSGDTLWAQPGYHYQWFYNGNYIQNANQPFYLPKGSGNYQVLVTDTFGCGLLSDSMMLWLGFIDASKVSIQMYPNPFLNELYIEAKGRGMGYLQVFAADSRCMYTDCFSGTKKIETGYWPRGIYILRWVQDEQEIKRILIRE